MKSISRKTAVIMGAIALVVALIVPGAALAAGWQPLESNPQTCPMAAEQDIACVGFVDADGDGACDNFGTCMTATRAGACNQDMMVCNNFIDANENGVCDNREAGASPNCGSFVDEDGNGTCDNWESGACPNPENAAGQGKGCGNGGCGMGRGMCGMR